MGSKFSTALPKEPPAITPGGEESPTRNPAMRRCYAEDMISGLPDELLHIILVRLQSVAAAARTSVLSRRWRRVWAHMPELALGGSPTPSTPLSALLDSIDAALNSYAAPTLHSLKIEVSGVDRWDVPAGRIALWLGFASQRLAGKLRLRILVKEDAPWYGDIKEDLALPICERATGIDLGQPNGDGHLTGFVLRLPPTGSFSALTDLKISCTLMDGGELGRVVSSQCPRLRKLYIFVTMLAPVCDVAICSESLECLGYMPMETGKLAVNAPMLQEISVCYDSHIAEACIVAPKLEIVKWCSRYDPGLHQIPVSGRHLQSLYITHSGMLHSSTRLMERYDSAKQLIVSLGIDEEIAGYMTFLKEMDKLPICESLVICFMRNLHALSAVMFHILRRCSCIKKLKLSFHDHYCHHPLKKTYCSMSGCPCLLAENYKLDGIAFDSLEEIKIKFFTGSDEQEEFMKMLLSKCSMVTLKRVNITIPLVAASSEIKEVVERIHSVCLPNRNIQFNVHAKPWPF